MNDDHQPSLANQNVKAFLQPQSCNYSGFNINHRTTFRSITEFLPGLDPI
jgi:hypothetical protein